MSDERQRAEYLEHGDAAPDAAALDHAARVELDAVRRALADDATWAEPPPGLGDAVVAGIAAARRDAGRGAEGAGGAVSGTGRTGGPVSGGEPGADGGAGRGGGGDGGDREGVVVPLARPSPGRLLGVAAALVVVSLAVGGLLGSRLGGDDPTVPDRGDEVALATTGLAPDADGWLTVQRTGSGLGITLWVEGLPPAPPGSFYQAWMRGDAGAVAVGTFHARDDDGEPIELWSGVEVDDYPTLSVTLQDEGAGPASSGRVVLTADLAGS